MKLICGPPGSGKTWYVDQHRAPGDVVIDYDAIQATVSGRSAHEPAGEAAHWVVFDMIQAALLRLAEGQLDLCAWVIRVAPKREERLRLALHLNAEIVLMETPLDVCRQRIEQREPESARLRGLAGLQEWTAIQYGVDCHGAA